MTVVAVDRQGLNDFKALREQAVQEGRLTPRMKEILSRKQGEKYRQPLMDKVNTQEGASTDGDLQGGSGKTSDAAAPVKRASAPAKPRVGTSSERKDKSPIKVHQLSRSHPARRSYTE